MVLFGIFGYLFVTPGADFDTTRHSAEFISIAARPFNDFWAIITNLYSEEGVKPDFVQKFIAFVVSRFTSDSQVYFAFLAMILGYFVSLVLKIVNLNKAQSRDIISLSLFILLVVILNPGLIQSFRHYFAALIFLITFSGLRSRFDIRGIVFIVFTMFIHYGFLPFIALYLVFLILGNTNWIYYLLTLFGIFFNDSSIEIILLFSPEVSGGLGSAVSGYTYSGYLEEIQELRSIGNVVVVNYITWMKYLMFALVLYLKFLLKSSNKFIDRTYSFSILFFAFLAFTEGVSYLHNRFAVLYILMCAILILNIRSQIRVKNLWVNLVVLVSCAIYILVTIRIVLQFFNIVLIAPFFPFSIFFDSGDNLLYFIE